MRGLCPIPKAMVLYNQICVSSTRVTHHSRSVTQTSVTTYYFTSMYSLSSGWRYTAYNSSGTRVKASLRTTVGLAVGVGTGVAIAAHVEGELSVTQTLAAAIAPVNSDGVVCAVLAKFRSAVLGVVQSSRRSPWVTPELGLTALCESIHSSDH